MALEQLATTLSGFRCLPHQAIFHVNIAQAVRGVKNSNERIVYSRLVNRDEAKSTKRPGALDFAILWNRQSANFSHASCILLSVIMTGQGTRNGFPKREIMIKHIRTLELN